MANLGNKRELAAVGRKNQKKYPGNNQSLKSAVLRINEKYITHLFEVVERSVTKILSQEYNKIKNRILGALFKLDDFLLHPQVQVQSETIPGISFNMNVKIQEPTEDRSQNDPHPEVGPSIYRLSQSMDSDTEELSYIYIVCYIL